MTLRSMPRGVSHLIMLLLIGACTDLAHVNPYDPAAPFEIRLSGPSVAVVGDTVTFIAQTTPAWTRAEAPEWLSFDSRVLFPLGGGRYVAVAAGTTMIRVRFGPHTDTRNVAVQPRVPPT